jgi:hypothetical protein
MTVFERRSGEPVCAEHTPARRGVDMHALEVGGRIDEKRHLVLDEVLPIQGPSRVRVIILFDEEELPEPLWLRAGTTNPAFDFLKEPEEDLYKPTDGRPFHDER